MFGGFKFLEESVKWKYGIFENRIIKEIFYEDLEFELFVDLKKVIIKEIKKDIWIRVEGFFYLGIVNVVG